MKIALVHDYLVQYGGAERVLESFVEIFPKAPIYTIVHDKKLMRKSFSKKKIYTSFLQKIPFVGSNHRLFPILMPIAIEQFDFSKYDIVLSDSSSYSKGIITGPNTLHIAYCHTPMRYAWDDCHKYFREFEYSSITKKLIPFAMNYIRMWDKISSDRPDKYITNSKFVAARIKKYYNKHAFIINPPVSTKNFYISKKINNYFLMLGRILPYKRFDIVVEAFRKLKLENLKIIGTGPEINKLKKNSSKNVEFLGYLDDNKASKYYAKCKAFIFPSEEDFGIVSLEAMASGRPVIAFKSGGALESVVENKTGIFFDKQTPKSIETAIKSFNSGIFNSKEIRKYAMKFDKEIFKRKIKKFIEEEYRNFMNTKIKRRFITM